VLSRADRQFRHPEEIQVIHLVHDRVPHFAVCVWNTGIATLSRSVLAGESAAVNHMLFGKHFPTHAAIACGPQAEDAPRSGVELAILETRCSFGATMLRAVNGITRG
jgi:hypothetical protein